MLHPLTEVRRSSLRILPIGHPVCPVQGSVPPATFNCRQRGPLQKRCLALSWDCRFPLRQGRQKQWPLGEFGLCLCVLKNPPPLKQGFSGPHCNKQVFLCGLCLAPYLLRSSVFHGLQGGLPVAKTLFPNRRVDPALPSGSTSKTWGTSQDQGF